MTFQSLEFLLFFPIVFLLYWTVCRKSRMMQNGLIVLASIVFYSWWDIRFIGLLLLTALSTFFAGWWLGKTDTQKTRKWISAGTIVLNVGILFFFKYYNFFVQSVVDVSSIMGWHIGLSTLKILLPVGISFYTFTALSYSIDVYQRKVKPIHDIIAYLAYVMFFPSILSGPISRAQKQLPQYFKRRSFDYDKAVSACKIILTGGVIKLCLADRLGIYVDAVYGNIAYHNGTTLLLTSILYTIQIYADFAGYSLMAIGCGRMLGIELPENFQRPYFACTVTEFWHRWHISLTTWFRDYIYFPLGGNRCSKKRWAFNIVAVFTISGLWHGAAYTFVIWGALHGLCMVIERLVYGSRIKSIHNNINFANFLRWILTFALVNFAWVFFRVNSLTEVFVVFKKIFSEPGSLFIDADTLFYAFIFTVFLFVVDFVDEYFKGKFNMLNNKYMVVRWGTYIAMVMMILLFGVLDGGSFIYFQF